MEVSAGGEQSRATVGQLRSEATKVRELVQSCREDGVDLTRFQERMRTTRELVTQRRFGEALAHLRELKLALLDEIVLVEAQPPVLPGVIENPSEPVAPAENPLPPPDRTSPNRRTPSWKVKMPRE